LKGLQERIYNQIMKCLDEGARLAEEEERIELER